MATTLLICDDSNLARKQVAKSLPANFNLDIHFATNGVEGVEALRKGIGDIMFLDLNMPEMDGYEVLQAIQLRLVWIWMVFRFPNVRTKEQKDGPPIVEIVKR